MYKDYEGWSETVKSILDMMKKTDIWALFKHPPAETYFRGRACLLGDAAHASTPHLGAGAGMAIEDAFILSTLLGQVNDVDSIDKAFRAYDLTRRPRTQRLVEASSQQGRLYDLELVGDDPSAVAKELATRARWVWEHDHKRELQEAQRLLKLQEGL
jgi:salicylate hydroxylase